MSTRCLQLLLHCECKKKKNYSLNCCQPITASGVTALVSLVNINKQPCVGVCGCVSLPRSIKLC